MFRSAQITILLIYICFFLNIVPSISQINEDVPLNNIVKYESSKQISPLVFENFLGNKVKIKDFNGKLIILNFWATWCTPCKKEMPSLDKLAEDPRFKNLVIFAINMETPNNKKTRKFFDDLELEKLDIFFDKNLNFVKAFRIRGVPTSILIDKKNKEFARIIGSINFQDKKFLDWLLKYD